MLKEHNIMRIIILGLVGIFIDSLIIGNFAIDFVDYISNKSNNLEFYYSIDFLLILIVVVPFNNIALHVMSESSLRLERCNSRLSYKTILTKKRFISNSSIRKIVICKENIFPKGQYESVLLHMKRCRRVVLISEYTMTAKEYQEKLSILFKMVDENKIIYKGKFYKQLVLLLGW